MNNIINAAIEELGLLEHNATKYVYFNHAQSVGCSYECPSLYHYNYLIVIVEGKSKNFNYINNSTRFLYFNIGDNGQPILYSDGVHLSNGWKLIFDSSTFTYQTSVQGGILSRGKEEYKESFGNCPGNIIEGVTKLLEIAESNGEIQQPDIDSLTAIIQEKDRQIESLTAELEAVRKQYQGCQDALNRIKAIIEEEEGERVKE